MMELDELAAVMAALQTLNRDNEVQADEPASNWKRAARLEAVGAE